MNSEKENEQSMLSELQDLVEYIEFIEGDEVGGSTDHGANETDGDVEWFYHDDSVPAGKHLDEDTLIPLVLGQLSLSDDRKWTRHSSRCEPCRKKVKSALALRGDVVSIVQGEQPPRAEAAQMAQHPTSTAGDSAILRLTNSTIESLKSLFGELPQRFQEAVQPGEWQQVSLAAPGRDKDVLPLELAIPNSLLKLHVSEDVLPTGETVSRVAVLGQHPQGLKRLTWQFVFMPEDEKPYLVEDRERLRQVAAQQGDEAYQQELNALIPLRGGTIDLERGEMSARTNKPLPGIPRQWRVDLDYGSGDE